MQVEHPRARSGRSSHHPGELTGGILAGNVDLGVREARAGIAERAPRFEHERGFLVDERQHGDRIADRHDREQEQQHA